MSTVFALDASGKTAGVCVLRDGQVLFERTLDEGLTHSETLLPLAEAAFSATDTAPAAVDAFALTTGPGSFTGLRIAAALVKGMALPFGTPVVPVSTLAALAEGCGLSGTVVCALNARRGEVYWAAFNCSGTCRRLTEDAAGPAADIQSAGLLERGVDFFVGDGAEICYNMLNFCPETGNGHAGPWPIARGAALWAQRALPAGAKSAAGLRLRYLRASQAERERAARLAQSHNSDGKDGAK